jgi:hypothetical protein
MAVALYLDVHVPQAIAEQLERRGVDVLTALQDGTTLCPDDELLDRSTQLHRVLVTFDVRFKVMAEDWQRKGRRFGGLIYAHPLHTSIGQLVKDLELFCKATAVDEWVNAIERLPL